MGTVVDALEAAEPGTFLIFHSEHTCNVYRKLNSGMWVMGVDIEATYTWYGFTLGQAMEDTGATWALS